MKAGCVKNYLSPCGGGRSEGAGEGYNKITHILKRSQKALGTQIFEKGDFNLWVFGITIC